MNEVNDAGRTTHFTATFIFLMNWPGIEPGPPR